MKSMMDGENLKYPFDFSKEWVLTVLDFYFSQECTLEEAFQGVIASHQSQEKSYNVLLKHMASLGEYGSFRLNRRTRTLLSLRFSEFLYSDAMAASYLRECEQWVLENSDLADAYCRLCQIPAMGSVSALTTLTELGNYYRFASWKALAKYAGVTPMIAQSGEQKSKGHINRFTNPHLRRAFTQMAAILINVSKKNTDLARYASLQYHQKRLPYKKALVKIGNKIAKTVYNVLILNVPYDPNHEYIQKRAKKFKFTLKSKKTLLEPQRTRALRRNIQTFLVTHSEFLNSTSRYHLVSGFHRLIRKSKHLDHKENEDEHGGKKN
jgi:hypothetical protein